MGRSRVLFDLDYLDDLVLRSLHVQLHLRVLIGRTHGPCGVEPCAPCPETSARAAPNHAANRFQMSE